MKDSSPSYIKLNKGSLELSLSSMATLGVGPGDKICVRFDPLPVICLPEVIGELNGGNLINNVGAVSCRGKANDMLRAIGEYFEYEQQSKGFIVLKPVQPDITLDEKTESDKSLTVSLPGATEVEFEYFKK